MMMKTIYCLLLVLSSLYIHIAVCDYAEYAAFIKEQAKNETFVRLFNEHARLYGDSSKNSEDFIFPCGAFPAPMSTTKNVHNLTPYDIGVIGALGDSITAGTGITAKTIVGLLREDRGLSWSIGGSNNVKETETVPNDLKVFNPNIKGFSTGWGPVWIESTSRFNVAVPGDKSEHVPYQARRIVRRMKKDSSIDFEKDWKLITIFIGTNDLCDFCDNRNKYSAESYIARIENALDYLHDNVPRVFVNLVQVLDVTMVRKLNQNFICNTLHFFTCRCAAFPKNSEAEAEIKRETGRYYAATEALVDSGKYDTRDDFTVVIQPFWKNTGIPMLPGTDKPDLGYFSPDCFHLSLKGHQAAAEALWNNMVEPVGSKRTKWTPGEPMDCPTMNAPYFYTKKNSIPPYHADANDQSRATDIISGSQSRKLLSGNPTVDNQSSSVSAIVMVIGGGVIALVLAAVGVVVQRRWTHPKEHKERELLLNPADMRQYS